jgi:hypothetical protein
MFGKATGSTDKQEISYLLDNQLYKFIKIRFYQFNMKSN